MPTECSAERFDFGMVEGRVVEAAFDAGLVTSDAGGLLLGAADRAIDLMKCSVLDAVVVVAGVHPVRPRLVAFTWRLVLELSASCSPRIS